MMRLALLVLAACGTDIAPASDARLAYSCVEQPVGVVDLTLAPCDRGLVIVEWSPFLNDAMIGQGVCLGSDCVMVSWGSVVEHFELASSFDTDTGRHFICGAL